MRAALLAAFVWLAKDTGKLLRACSCCCLPAAYCEGHQRRCSRELFLPLQVVHIFVSNDEREARSLTAHSVYASNLSLHPGKQCPRDAEGGLLWYETVARHCLR